jgi:catechol 2,3-dioxygenase-like lactoylglutathione lyase family enzyme
LSGAHVLKPPALPEDAYSAEKIMTAQAPPPKNGMESLQLINVAVSVRALDQAIVWYTDKLGFTLNYRTAAIKGIELALMEKNGLYIDLIHHPQPVSLEPEPKDPPFHLQITGLRNLVFFVDDIAAADAELKAKGVPLMWESNFLPHLGTKVTAFRDMDGNLVAFWQKNDQILNYLHTGHTENS